MGRNHGRTGVWRSIKRGKVTVRTSVVDRNGSRQASESAEQSRKMKLLILALAFVLLFTAGGALDCKRCVPSRAGGSCQTSVETCKPNKNACIAARFLRQPFGHFQRCIAYSDCKMLQANAYIDVKCCTEDMCNTF